MATIVISKAFDINFNADAPLQDGGLGRPDWKEGAGQIFKAGDPVMQDPSTGLIVLVTASSNLIGTMLGFARNDATGVTNTPVLIRMIRDFDRIVMNVKNSGGSSVTADAMLGDVIGFDIDTTGSTNNLVANPAKTATTNPFGRVAHLWTAANGYADSSEVVGDTNGRIVVSMRSFGFQG